jgi:hypothetical protein
LIAAIFAPLSGNHPTSRSPGFAERAASQFSITRTMSVNDQSFVVTLPAPAGDLRQLENRRIVRVALEKAVR